MYEVPIQGFQAFLFVWLTQDSAFDLDSCLWLLIDRILLSNCENPLKLVQISANTIHLAWSLDQHDDFLMADYKSLNGNKLFWKLWLVKLWSINSMHQTNIKAMGKWSVSQIVT